MGTPMEHHHMKTLLRNEGRSTHHMSARSKVGVLRASLAHAAQALAQTRCFSAHSLLSGPDFKHLRSLLLKDASGMIDADAERRDREEVEQELAQGDRETLRKRASLVLKRWMPSAKQCAVLCRQCAAPAEASAGADGGKTQDGGDGGKTRGGEAADEQNERESERSKYCRTSFDKDKMAVRLVHPTP